MWVREERGATWVSRGCHVGMVLLQEQERKVTECLLLIVKGTSQTFDAFRGVDVGETEWRRENLKSV